MEEFLVQIRLALRERLYYLALHASLSIPSICGAMESGDGIDTKARYIGWFDEWVAPRVTVGDVRFMGKDCYAFRCSLLHQGRFQGHDSSYARLIVTVPDNPIFSHGALVHGALSLNVAVLCELMVDGAERWYQEEKETDAFKRNFELYATYRPDGLEPYFNEGPVIA